MMEDERKGRPSASAMGRYDLCPGSWAMPMAEEDSTAESLEGDRVHAALAGISSPNDLSETERGKYVYLDRLKQVVLDRYGGLALAKEERIWAPSGAWSGKPDGVISAPASEETGTVYDYKAGFLKVSDAARNLQLRSLIVLAHWRWPEIRIWHGAVLQYRRPITVTTYEGEILEAAVSQITSIVESLDDEEAERNPGPEQCRFCPAKNVCPEYQSWTTGAVEVLAPLGESLAASWTPQRWARFLSVYGEAKKWMERLREEAKKTLKEDEDAIPGFALKPGKTATRVESDALPDLIANGYSLSELLPAIRVSVPELRSIMKAKSGLGDERLEALLYDTVAEHITKTQYADEIVEI